MKKNTYCLKITLICTAIAFLTGCETGVKNKSTESTVPPSGIVDKGNDGYVGTQQKSSSTKASSRKIFSNSATPGYYLQVGFFKQAKPNSSFINRLNSSGFDYTVLDKNGNFYALIGAYTSYNQAKSKMSTVKSALNSQTFVVQVLRP